MYDAIDLGFAIFVAFLGGSAVVLWILRPKA